MMDLLDMMTLSTMFVLKCADCWDVERMRRRGCRRLSEKFDSLPEQI